MGQYIIKKTILMRNGNGINPTNNSPPNMLFLLLFFLDFLYLKIALRLLSYSNEYFDGDVLVQLVAMVTTVS